MAFIFPGEKIKIKKEKKTESDEDKEKNKFNQNEIIDKNEAYLSCNLLSCFCKPECSNDCLATISRA
jgi:hypothetical protein